MQPDIAFRGDSLMHDEYEHHLRSRLVARADALLGELDCVLGMLESLSGMVSSPRRVTEQVREDVRQRIADREHDGSLGP